MRNWKFLLTSQLIRGNWFLLDDHAISGLVDVAQILNPTQSLNTLTETLADRQPYPISFTNNSLIEFSASSSENGSAFDAMPEGSIAMFSISGTLLKYGTWCSYGTEEIGAILMEAADHPNISGALFIVDSGGGGVNAVAPLTQAIEKFKANKKPTLALCDAAYSAAYWFACACDHIMADNTISAGFGSIGVMCSWVDYTDYYEKLGIKEISVYAPESTEKNKSVILAREGKFDELKIEELSPLAQNFIAMVKENRPMLKDDGKVLKGKTYLASKALEIGLIDSIGNRQQAKQKLSNMIIASKFLNS
nr:S49 family peptidase [uncultured Pedobacter sp.]